MFVYIRSAEYVEALLAYIPTVGAPENPQCNAADNWPMNRITSGNQRTLVIRVLLLGYTTGPYCHAQLAQPHHVHGAEQRRRRAGAHAV